MLTISHRGNIKGKDSNYENNPNHIQKLLNVGMNVEIDVWKVGDSLLLGHDYPQHLVDLKFLQNNGLWCHAKNLEALYFMGNSKIENYFWHEEDKYTLTSSGYIWTFPAQKVTSSSIIVDNTKNWKESNYDCYAVCSDYL